MKIFDPKRHLPVGWDWENLKIWICWGHFFSSLTALTFLGRYFDARGALYIYLQNPDGTLLRELDPSRTIAPFWDLMAGMPYLGLGFFGIVMLILVWRFYHFHTQDSMSIYTMRRLPDKWELHRRCLMQPVLSMVVEALIFAALTVLCWLLWRFATPAVCLPM